MFRLKATLVATTVLRPWRTGWSVERGVDFSLALRPKTPAPQIDRPLGERACFIEDDWCPPPGATVVRSFTSLAAGGGNPEPTAPDEAPEAGMRAWWSLAGKPSRT